MPRESADGRRRWKSLGVVCGLGERGRRRQGNITSLFFIFYFELLLLILGYGKKNTDFKRCGNSEFPSPHLQLVEMMTIPGPLLLVAAAVAAAS